LEYELNKSKQEGQEAGGILRRREASSAEPSMHPVEELQQQAGNQAVQGLLRSGAIQAKLEVSNPSDPAETEAEQTADRVMRASENEAPCSCTASGGEMCDECKQKQRAVHRAADGAAETADVPGIVGDVLHSPGRPLDKATRAFFEARLGQDLSDVRVHTGSEAARSARAINAQAYTAGKDVVFGSGQYSPDSTRGRRLLAHELAHVVQPSALGIVRRAPSDGTADPQPAKVKNLVQSNDPTPNHELFQLIAANALDNKAATAVGPIMAGGAANTWVLKVQFKAPLGTTGTTRGQTQAETLRPIPGPKQGTIHEIQIAINKYLLSSSEELSAHPELQERMNYMAAEALLHELIHVRLKIDRALASLGVSAVSVTGSNLQILRSNLPAAKAQEDQVKTGVTMLLGIAGQAIGRPVMDAQTTATFLTNTIDTLVEEKFAKQTAGRPFGLGSAITNDEIADAYSRKVADKIYKDACDLDYAKGYRLNSDKKWDDSAKDLKASVKRFFDKLDGPTHPAIPDVFINFGL
jgi:hypothetical protein